jgi:hypothetical protein
MLHIVRNAMCVQHGPTKVCEHRRHRHSWSPTAHATPGVHPKQVQITNLQLIFLSWFFVLLVFNEGRGWDVWMEATLPALFDMLLPFIRVE